MCSAAFAWATTFFAAPRKATLPPVWSLWWCVLTSRSTPRLPERSFSPSRQAFPSAGNCVSTTTTPPGFTSQPTVPPRFV